MPLIRDLVVVSMAMAPPAVAGTFAYTPASGTVLADGSYMLRADFTPADATTYSSVSAVVPFTVALPVPLYPAAITWPQPAAINYGTPLSSVQLNATGTNTPPSIQVPLLDYYRLDTVFNDGQGSGTEGLKRDWVFLFRAGSRSGSWSVTGCWCVLCWHLLRTWTTQRAERGNQRDGAASAGKLFQHFPCLGLLERERRSTSRSP